MAENKYPLVFEFIAKTKGFVRDLDISENKIKSFGNQMTKTGRMLSTRLSLPLAAVGGLALRQAAKFERLTVTLNTLTGSANKGSKAFERLVQFSAETPLQLEELTRVNNMLMGFGQSSDDAFKSLKMLGDVSAITGGNLTGIAVAFGQAAAEGRVMTRDLRQFINNGVPILQLLSEEMGVAEGAIMDLASEGKLTFDILNTAFEKATSDGGRFNDGLKILSQTLEGLFSTLKDNVNIALAELGQEIAETLNLKEGIPALSKKIGELVKGFKGLNDDTQKLIINAGLLAIAIPPITIALGFLISSVATISGALVALNPIVLAITTVVAGLGAAFVGAKVSGVSFGETIKNVLLSGGNAGVLASLQAKSQAAKLAIDELALSMQNAFTDPLGFTGAKPKGFPTIPSTTTTTSGAGAGDTGDTGGGFLGINPFILGTGFQSLAGIVTTEIPRMTNVTNGFALAMENIKTKFTDFKENAIIPVTEELKKTSDFSLQFAQHIGQTLMSAFANLGQGEDAFKRLGEQLKALIIRLAVAAGLAMVISAALGKPTNMGKIFSALSGFGSIPMAKGGIVSGPTTALIGEYPGARSNPEVVAPLSKLKSMIDGGTTQGEFVLRGQDLVVALQRAERNRNRFK
jgi:tape measure domain-containing protein